MVTPRLKVLACALASIALLISCGDGGVVVGSGGSTGGGGSGGMSDEPDAGVNCVLAEAGCNDGNDCTVDGVCESTTQMCIGRAPEPIDTPCGDDDLFVCDGAGTCVGCNVDSQCDAFFPDEECRLAPRCIGNACPLPEPRPDGTTCSTGECRAGVCTSPWAPKRQFVPMVCGTSVDASLFQSPMDLTISPTPIASASSFSATASASIRIPREFLQDALIDRFPEPLTAITLSGARAEVVTTGVTEGGTVATSLTPLPQDITIPQASIASDGGGQLCGGGGPGCPLAAFGQRCGFSGVCRCACRPGCDPAECANVVISDVILDMQMVQGAIYTAESEGEVCFDAGGNFLEPEVQDRIRTGLRMSTFPGPLAIECAGGFVDDNGTPQVRNDDFVAPNTPSEQICFPIESP